MLAILMERVFSIRCNIFEDPPHLGDCPGTSPTTPSPPLHIQVYWLLAYLSRIGILGWSIIVVESLGTEKKESPWSSSTAKQWSIWTSANTHAN